MPTDRVSPSILYYGAERQPPERHFLRAGPLSLVYEAGEIRYITLGEREIVRRIYGTLRDQDWATILPRISDLDVRSKDDSFALTFRARHQQGGIAFSWKGTVVGDARGNVSFSMQGTAESSFWQSRLGICVLHPIRGLAGTPCTIEQPDGTNIATAFPFEVSPHRPFTNIRAMKYSVKDGIQASVRFQGGVFESEDQRNWTDGSYKTYSPPLAVPYPSEILAGTQVSQGVRVEISAEGLKLPVDEKSQVCLTLAAEPCGMLPNIGIGFASGNPPLASRQQLRLQRLHLSHLRVDLDLSDPGFREMLEAAWADARALAVPLQIALVLSDSLDEPLQDLVTTLRRVRPSVSAWLISRTPGNTSTPESLRAARKYLSDCDKNALIGGGSNANFVDVNQSRPDPADMDFIGYPAHPQVHLSDDDTLVEALEAQAWVVQTAKGWSRRPVFVSPVTFKQRPASPAANVTGNSACDPRQTSLFGAAWTMGSLKYLAEAGASNITYFETHGTRGVQGAGPGGDTDSVYPLYQVLADVGEFAGAKVVATQSSAPLLVAGLALLKEGRLRFLCANFSERPQSIVVRGIRGAALLFELNDSNADFAMQNPDEFRAAGGRQIACEQGSLTLVLPPYGIARIDAEAAS